jgi:hypothetical protein
MSIAIMIYGDMEKQLLILVLSHIHFILEIKQNFRIWILRKKILAEDRGSHI